MSRDTLILLGVLVGVVGIVTLVIAIRMAVRLVVIKRSLRDLGAGGKFAFWGALAYLIFPIDILPDPIYLDDITVVGAAIWFLSRLLRKQEAMRDALPHARAVAEVAARRRRARIKPFP
jgi:uncharacterized membrane protein YkvA (DUF1232 family)